MIQVKLLLNIPVYYYQHRHLTEARNTLSNGLIVLTGEVSSDPGKSGAGRSGGIVEHVLT
jgi:hypothetical protein